jgi:hypothetical protein
MLGINGAARFGEQMLDVDGRMECTVGAVTVCMSCSWIRTARHRSSHPTLRQGGALRPSTLRACMCGLEETLHPLMSDVPARCEFL